MTFTPLPPPPAVEPFQAKGLGGLFTITQKWMLWLNSLTALQRLHGTITATIDLASVAAATCAAQNVAVTGVTTDMVLDVQPKVINGVGIVGAYCLATDVLTVVCVNPTAGAIDATATSCTLSYWRR